MVGVPQAEMLARLQIGEDQLQSGLVLPSSCSCTHSTEEVALSPHWLSLPIDSPHWLVAVMLSNKSPVGAPLANVSSLKQCSELPVQNLPVSGLSFRSAGGTHELWWFLLHALELWWKHSLMSQCCWPVSLQCSAVTAASGLRSE